MGGVSPFFGFPAYSSIHSAKSRTFSEFTL
jgi:hypothetical protein